MTENEKDIQLLQTDTGRLIVKYQAIIRIIVGKYVASGMFRKSEADEVVQTVNDLLFQKMAQIQTQFNGSTMLTTYLSSIIRHVCIDLHHKRKRTPQHVGLEEAGITDPSGTLHHLLIQDEVATFRAIMTQFHRQEPKVYLCLKLFFRISITRRDVLTWYPQCSPKDLQFLLESFGSSYDETLGRDVFRLFTKVINKAEGKTNSPHAIQSWTSVRINQILELLNGDPPLSAHNEETLKILLEEYTSSFLQV